jgi:hypothetical protein
VRENDLHILVSLHDDPLDTVGPSQKETDRSIEVLIEEAAMDCLDTDELTFIDDPDVRAGAFVAARFRGL